MVYDNLMESYVGEWKDGTFHGLGVHKTLEIEYRGEFKYGKAVIFEILFFRKIWEFILIWSMREEHG